MIAESIGNEADPFPLEVVLALPRLAMVGRVTLDENAGTAFCGEVETRADEPIVLVVMALVVVEALTFLWLPNPANAALVLALISLSLAWRATSALPRPCETLLRMLPPNRLLTLPCLFASVTECAALPPLLADAVTSGLRTLGSTVDVASPLVECTVVTTPVNLFLTLVDGVIALARLIVVGAKLARELMLRDMAACCCCCFANAASRFCACMDAAVFLADPPPTNVLLVALITVLRSDEAALTDPLPSPTTLTSDLEEATLNL